jgi:hypothetical protein
MDNIDTQMNKLNNDINNLQNKLLTDLSNTLTTTQQAANDFINYSTNIFDKLSDAEKKTQFDTYESYFGLFEQNIVSTETIYNETAELIQTIEEELISVGNIVYGGTMDAYKATLDAYKITFDFCKNTFEILTDIYNTLLKLYNYWYSIYKSLFNLYKNKDKIIDDKKKGLRDYMKLSTYKPFLSPLVWVIYFCFILVNLLVLFFYYFGYKPSLPKGSTIDKFANVPFFIISIIFSSSVFMSTMFLSDKKKINIFDAHNNLSPIGLIILFVTIILLHGIAYGLEAIGQSNMGILTGGQTSTTFKLALFIATMGLFASGLYDIFVRYNIIKTITPSKPSMSDKTITIIVLSVILLIFVSSLLMSGSIGRLFQLNKYSMYGAVSAFIFICLIIISLYNAISNNPFVLVNKDNHYTTYGASILCSLIILIVTGVFFFGSDIAGYIGSFFNQFGQICKERPLLVTFVSIICMIVLLINTYKLFPHTSTSIFIISAVTIAIIGAIGFLYYSYAHNNTNIELTSPNFNIRLLLNLVGTLGVVGLIAIILKYAVPSDVYTFSGTSTTTSILLNVLIMILLLTILYFVLMKLNFIRNSPYLKLFVNVILFIPCFLFWIYDKIMKDYNNTGSSTTFLIVTGFLVLLTLFLYPGLNKYYYTKSQGGKQFVNAPLSTSSRHVISTYNELNGLPRGSEQPNPNYRYSLSFWYLVDANGSKNNSDYYNILSYGDKPAIRYNPAKNTLIISVKPTKDDEGHDYIIDKSLKINRDLSITRHNVDNENNMIVYKLDEVLLQKWNNVVINYEAGTLDLFVNGELVNSAIDIMPYVTFDTITIGEENGISGGVCNLVYYKTPISYSNILSNYNQLKGTNPPILPTIGSVISSELDRYKV